MHLPVAPRSPAQFAPLQLPLLAALVRHIELVQKIGRWRLDGHDSSSSGQLCCVCHLRHREGPCAYDNNGCIKHAERMKRRIVMCIEEPSIVADRKRHACTCCSAAG
eukprot:CAMPEP_0119340774 /NCGR_PEP_ID=MMETSP1333-20130426/101005_1 /TAXON_ID=418940 /ORGANISM="Scyphosphaera apsteinii, Strain RCC1455" /LENGTH=106 /DNA_ID=CAMNT_0007352595 /DNA_START=93 /DNA_END=414 /DNA_ORIENTATION=-